MRKSILSFFAGICLVILTAAATGITEVKPANPKFIAMDYFWSVQAAKDYIVKKSREGFVLKTCSSDYRGLGLVVVMEKY